MIIVPNTYGTFVVFVFHTKIMLIDFLVATRTHPFLFLYTLMIYRSKKMDYQLLCISFLVVANNLDSFCEYEQGDLFLNYNKTNTPPITY